MASRGGLELGLEIDDLEEAPGACPPGLAVMDDDGHHGREAARTVVVAQPPLPDACHIDQHAGRHQQVDAAPVFQHREDEGPAAAHADRVEEIRVPLPQRFVDEAAGRELERVDAPCGRL